MNRLSALTAITLSACTPTLEYVEPVANITGPEDFHSLVIYDATNTHDLHLEVTGSQSSDIPPNPDIHFAYAEQALRVLESPLIDGLHMLTHRELR